MAKRHLAILDDLRQNYPDIFPSDIQSRFEVISTEMILTELIQNIEIVQKDPSQLKSFLNIYCIKTPQPIKPDTERIDDLEAEIALLKSTVKQLLQILSTTDIDLERNYHDDIIGAKLDWDKADLYELRKPLN